MSQQMLEALSFYADPKSYCTGHNGPEVMRDLGVKAKEALMLADQLWRPMESAPKDGSTIVLVGSLASGWDHGRLRACVTYWHRAPGDEGWIFSCPGFSDAFNPIGWLPAPLDSKEQQ